MSDRDKERGTTMTKKSYNLRELAAAWNVHQCTVRRLIERGDLHAFRVGAGWRINQTERERIEQINPRSRSAQGE